MGYAGSCRLGLRGDGFLNNQTLPWTDSPNGHVGIRPLPIDFGRPNFLHLRIDFLRSSRLIADLVGF